MSETTNHRIIGIALVAIATVLLSLALVWTQVFEEIENRTWDWRLKLLAVSAGEPKVAIIMIDQASLDVLARDEGHVWPWQRSVYGAALSYLTRAGARVAAFDMLLTEPSSYGPDDDEALAATLESSLPVVSAVALRHSTSFEDPADVQLFRKRQSILANTPLVQSLRQDGAAMPSYGGLTLPVTPLLRTSAAFGNVQGDPDSDGIFRHFAPLVAHADQPVLSLPFAAFALAYPARAVNLAPFFNTHGTLAVNFRGPKGSIPTHPFVNIYRSAQNLMADTSPLVPFEEFRDRIVFIGTDAPGLLDLRPTPLSPNFPGVEYNATVLSNLLRGDFIKQASTGIEIALTLFFGITATLAVFLLRSVREQLLMLCLLATAGLCGAYLAAAHGYWVNAVNPGVAFGFAMIASLSFQYSVEGRQHRFIRNAFRHYVSPAVIDGIVKNPAQLSLGGQRRELTMLFSDIAGFTSISEKLEATKLVALLNTYLSSVTNTILESGGTLDKYVGDAVVAFWNAPLATPKHALCAVQAAMTCQDLLARMQPRFLEEYGVAMKTRIGLHTGEVNVGNFGSAARFNYTVLGDAANLASRLEGANKYFGTSILISDTTFAGLEGRVRCRKIADIRVVGKAHAVGVYEPMYPAHPMMNEEYLCEFEQAVAAFYKGNFDEALASFQGLVRLDAVTRVYVSRIERDRARPADNWSPVWQLTEK